MADAQNHRIKTYPYSQLLRSQTYTFVIMFLSRLTKVSTLVVCNIHLNQTLFTKQKSGKTESWNIWAASQKKSCEYRRTPISGRSDIYGLWHANNVCLIAYMSSNGADQTVY